MQQRFFADSSWLSRFALCVWLVQTKELTINAELVVQPAQTHIWDDYKAHNAVCFLLSAALMWEYTRSKTKSSKVKEKPLLVWSLIEFGLLSCLLNHFNPFRFAGRGHMWVKAGPPLEGDQFIAGPWTFMSLVPCSRVPKQCSVGVLVPLLPEQLPCFVCYGAQTRNPPLLSPAPDSLSSHRPL